MKKLFFLFAMVSVLAVRTTAQNVGIGTTNPVYKFQVTDGPIALYSTTDLKAWFFGYSNASNYFYLQEDGFVRVTVANGGNVGIGTTAPTAKLDVVGNANVNGNIAATGDITVENGKGLIHNTAGSTALKYYTRTATFTAILGGNALSVEGSTSIGGGFTSPPQVLVGDIVSTGGTVGELYRVQLVIYDVTATNCHARLLNTSPNPVNYSITWNIICIGN